jgi:hypothetical protein
VRHQGRQAEKGGENSILFRSFMKGKFLHWDDIKANGVVLSDDGTRFFVYLGRIIRAPEQIKKGMLVDFEPAPGPPHKGNLPLAIQVTVYEAPASAAPSAAPSVEPSAAPSAEPSAAVNGVTR